MFARSRLFFSVKNDTMFEADKITEKNKKQRFYEKGIYSKIFHRRFLAFALFAYGFFGFAGDFVGAKSSVSAYGENAGDVTIEKLGHEPGEWIVDREPTAEETGHRYKECIRCNEVIEEEILGKLPPEDNGMDKGEGDKDDGTDDGKNDDGGKDDGSSGGNNGDAGNVGGEPQPTPDNDKSESESGKNDVSPSLAILLPISALIVLPLIIAAVKSIRKKR